jgi:hypothetical protein
MSAAQKVREPAGVPGKDKVDWTESTMQLFTDGVGRIADVHKKHIDFAVQQNTGLMDVWKNAVRRIPGAPGMFLLELQASGFARFADVQRAAVDLVVEQSNAFAALVKDRTAAAAKATEEVDAFAKKSVERVIAMQKKALDQSAVQAKAVVEGSHKQFAEGTPMEAAADSLRRGVDAMVDAQKELLNLAVH